MKYFSLDSMKTAVCVSTALLLILIVVFCNEWTLAGLFSSYGILKLGFKAILWLFDISLIIAAMIIIFYRKTKLCLLAFSLLLSFVFAEISFRLFLPQIPKEKSQHDRLFEYHSILGWQFIPDKSVLMPLRGGRKNAINSAGMRDREYTIEKPKGTKRIIVIGDSISSGLEVEEHEVFSEIMENSLLSGVEVLNFGINGFGPAQEFLLLKDRGFKYSPDIVLMLLNILNDFDDLSGTYSWIEYYKRPGIDIDKDGNMFFTGIPVSFPKKKPFFSLHLVAFLRKTLIYKYDARRMPPEFRFCKIQYSTEVARAYDLMETIIKNTSSLCHENNTEFVVAVVPTAIQVYEDTRWDKNSYDLYLPNNTIRTICEKAGVWFIDLTSVLKEKAEIDNKSYYFEKKHWNSAGHAIVAQAVVDFLRNKKLVPSENILQFHQKTDIALR